LTGAANGVSGMLFPIITGVIVDRVGYSPVFIMAALMPMIGILILFATLKNYQRVEVRHA
jgi:MFS family permease